MNLLLYYSYQLLIIRDLQFLVVGLFLLCIIIFAGSILIINHSLSAGNQILSSLKVPHQFEDFDIANQSSTVNASQRDEIKSLLRQRIDRKKMKSVFVPTIRDDMSLCKEQDLEESPCARFTSNKLVSKESVITMKHVMAPY